VSAVVIVLAGDPQGKGRARHRNVKTKDGREFTTTYTPAKTRRYEAALQAAAVKAMRGREKLDGALRLLMIAVIAVPESWSKRKRDLALAGRIRPVSKPDWDNLAKTCDALNKIVWVDDARVVDGRIVKWYGPEPEVEIRVGVVDVEAEFRARQPPPLELRP
jgi:Holliday junction resolvase RusA-like endonuclease